MDGPILCHATLCLISWTDRQSCAESSGLCCFEFFCNIGDEDNLLCCDLQLSNDALIALRLFLRSHSSVEITRNEIGQISIGCVGEQNLLSQRAARRVDRGPQACLVPLEKAHWDVIKYFALKFALPEALLPDESLQNFEGWRLPVVIHEPDQVIGDLSKQLPARYLRCACGDIIEVSAP